MRAVIVGLILSGFAAVQKPVEIDRTLRRVHGAAIMASDVRQARLLRLVGSASGSDDAALTALENRLLMLRDAVQAAVGEPQAPQIAARRKTWTDSWPAGTDLPALLDQCGMTDRGLDGWFRDDLRIEAHLDQRFGAPGARREDRITAWIRDLRLRANLVVK